MSATRPNDVQERKEKIPPFEIRITSFRLAGEYICKVDNINPGATLARGKGTKREEAEAKALAKAKELLSRTRVFEG